MRMDIRAKQEAGGVPAAVVGGVWNAAVATMTSLGIVLVSATTTTAEAAAAAALPHLRIGATPIARERNDVSVMKIVEWNVGNHCRD